MARYDNLHSRLVSKAKILLPLVSLALLATIFLFARDTDTNPSLPYANVDLEKLAHEQRLDGPSFASVTQDGAELTLSATRVRPQASNEGVINSSGISGQLVIPDNGTVILQAQNGTIDNASRIAELSGDVVINTSTGYHLATDHIATRLDLSKIESPGAIRGTAPFGDISAGAMEISQDRDSSRYLLVFKDRVKLVYQP